MNCRFHFRRRRLFNNNHRNSPSGRAASRKCSISSHREPCLTHLREDCDGEPDNLENYIKHCQLQQQQQQQQQQCLYRAVIHADTESPYTHTCEHPLPLLAATACDAPDVTDVSKLAGIHRSHSFSSSAYASRGELCSIQDCNRPCGESVPMVECPMPRTLVRTNSKSGARKPIPVDTPRYFVLEQQPS